MLARIDVAASAISLNFLEANDDVFTDKKQKRIVLQVELNIRLTKYLLSFENDFIENDGCPRAGTENVVLLQVVLIPNIPAVLDAAIEICFVGLKPLLSLLQSEEVVWRITEGNRHTPILSRFVISRNNYSVLYSRLER